MHSGIDYFHPKFKLTHRSTRPSAGCTTTPATQRLYLGIPIKVITFKTRRLSVRKAAARKWLIHSKGFTLASVGCVNLKVDKVLVCQSLWKSCSCAATWTAARTRQACQSHRLSQTRLQRSLWMPTGSRNPAQPFSFPLPAWCHSSEVEKNLPNYSDSAIRHHPVGVQCAQRDSQSSLWRSTHGCSHRTASVVLTSGPGHSRWPAGSVEHFRLMSTSRWGRPLRHSEGFSMFLWCGEYCSALILLVHCATRISWLLWLLHFFPVWISFFFFFFLK